MELLRIFAMALLAMADGYQCDLGQRIPDWYAYYDANSPIVRSYAVEVDSGAGRQMIGLFEMANDDRVLFFYNPNDLPHGTCAVVLDR